MDRAGLEPAGALCFALAPTALPEGSAVTVTWPLCRRSVAVSPAVTAPQFALATPEAMPQQGGDRLLPLQYQWIGQESNLLASPDL